MNNLLSIQFTVIALAWDASSQKYVGRIARVTRPDGKQRHLFLLNREINSRARLARALTAAGTPVSTLPRGTAFHAAIAKSYQPLRPIEQHRVPIAEAQSYCDRLNQS